MPFQPLFGKFEPLITSRFEKAKADGGLRVAAVDLEIKEQPRGRGKGRAEFLVIDPDGPVRITWNGVASLWAFGQGVARVARRTFDGKRKGLEKIEIKDGDELERGLFSLELARRLCTGDVPAEAASAANWPNWAPPINPSPLTGTDDSTGNLFFLGALDWIFRHELAHISLNHAERQKQEGLSTSTCEIEADLEATRSLAGSLQSNPDRIAGVRPERDELALELRAIFLGLGLTWVALCEDDLGRPNVDYPPVAERLAKCIRKLGLREDSGGAEILHDAIHTWIAPEASWAPSGGYPTALDALNEAIFRLHDHMRR